MLSQSVCSLASGKLMLMILLITLLLSVNRVTATLCGKDVSSFTLELRDRIVNASITNHGADSSGMHGLECTKAEGR